jgi:cobalt-precorrin 5A hydrolase
MARGEAMIAAGFGCRRGCALADLQAALEQALAHSNVSLADLRGLFAPDSKVHESALSELAKQLYKPLVFLPRDQLLAQSSRTLTHSAHSLEHYGVPSVAEAAALAGVTSLSHATPRLLTARHVIGGATCALAQLELS